VEKHILLTFRRSTLLNSPIHENKMVDWTGKSENHWYGYWISLSFFIFNLSVPHKLSLRIEFFNWYDWFLMNPDSKRMIFKLYICSLVAVFQKIVA
jgi:hypothetical protein